jgi:hypothetical protein
MRSQFQRIGVALVVGIAFASVSLAQSPTGRVEMAVVEFTPGPKVSGMTVEAKRQLQATTAYLLVKNRKFHVVDVRNTRYASQENLAAINGGSTAAAVQLGRKLRVAYVLTGTVEEYTPQGSDGYGHLVLRTRLVEVATGKVRYTEQSTHRSTSRMLTDNPAEMQTRTVKPALEEVTAKIMGLGL